MEKESIVAPVQIVLDAGAAARQLVTSEIQCHPGFADLHNRLGLLEVFEGRPDRAVQSFREALGINPGYFWAASNLAFALVGAGNEEEADELFSFRSVFADEEPFWVCRAALLLESDRPGDALEAIQNAPDSHDGYRAHIAGLAHLRLGSRESARDALTKAAAACPALDRLYRQRELLGPGALEKVNPRQAAAPIRVFPGLFDLYDFFAEIYARHGFRTRSIQSYDEGQVLWPDECRNSWNMGRLASWLGHGTEARSHFEEAIRHDPEAVDVYVALAMEYAVEGEMHRAIMAYERAAELRPGYADIRYQLGLAYMDVGRHEDAIDAFKRSLSINPSFDFSRLNLALALRESGRYGDAIHEYEKLLSSGRATADLYYNLGRVYLADEEAVRAEAMFRKGIETNPDFSLNYFYLGLACQKQGQKRQAQSAWRQFLERNRESELTEIAQRHLEE